MASKSLTFDIFGRDKTASKTLNGIGKSANNMGVTFAKVGKVIAAAAAVAVVAWAKSSVDSLVRIERINAQTTAVLKSTGGAAKVSAGHIEDLAAALERKTATEGESIQEGANLLLTFKNIRNEAGKGNDIFDQTTSVMVDVARAMGTDAAGSAVQLGKALNDPVAGISALSRVGITFTDDQKDLIASLVESGDMMGAQKVILAELQDQFGGSGAAFAETFAGKVELIGHRWGEVGEAVFTEAMPALEDLADFTDETLLPMLEDFADWFGEDGLPAIKDFASWIDTDLVPALKRIKTTYDEDVYPALYDFGYQLGELGTELGHFSDDTESVFDDIRAAMDEVRPAVVRMAAAIGAGIASMMLWFAGLPRRIAGAFAGAGMWLHGAGVRIMSGLAGGMASAMGWVKDRINSAIAIVNGAIGKINVVGDALRAATGGKVGFHINKIPMLATGGTALSAGLALVGERGPELLHMPKGASVIPLDRVGDNSKTGSRGGDTFNIHTPHDGASVAQSVQRRQIALAAV